MISNFHRSFAITAIACLHWTVGSVPTAGQLVVIPMKRLEQVLRDGTAFSADLNSKCGDVTGKSRREFYRSTDGGSTWLNVSRCDSTRIQFVRRLQMLDTLVGYAIDDKPGPRTFLRTIDGGRTWTTIGSTGANNLFFFDSVEGLRDAPAGLERTTDGGATWSAPDSTILTRWWQFPTSSLGYTMIKLAEQGADNGWRFGRSSDRGRTWKPMPLVPFSLEDLRTKEPSFTSAAVGYAYSQNELFRTSDSGTTWIKLPSTWQSAIDARTTIQFRGLKFVSDSIGFFAGVCYDFGDDILLGKSFIVRTTDGGANWTALRLNGKRNLPDSYEMAIHVSDNGTAYFRNMEINKSNLYKYECVRAESGFTTSGPITFNEGDSAIISARDGVAYKWSTGDSTREIKVRYGGRYGLRLVLADNCVVYDTMAVTVYAMVRATALADRQCAMECDGIGLNTAAERAAIVGYCDGGISLRQYRLPTLAEMMRSEYTALESPRVRAAAMDRMRATYMLVQVDTFDASIVKLNSSGGLAWAYDLPKTALASGFYLKLDQSDRPVVALSQWVSSYQAYSHVVVRLNGDGSLSYRGAFRHVPLSTVRPVALTIGDDGRVSSLASMNGDMVVVEYAEDGTPLPVRVYSYSAESVDVAHTLSIGRNGDAIVSGMAYTERDTFAVVAALGSDGSVRWQRAERAVRFEDSRPNVTATADGGAVIVIHGPFFKGDSLAPSVTRVSSDGDVIWRRQISSDTSEYQSLRHIGEITASVVDHFGNVYLAGPEPGYTTYPKAFWTERFDASGDKRWEIRSDQAGMPESIIVEDDGVVYVGARRMSPSPGCILQRLEQVGSLSAVPTTPTSGSSIRPMSIRPNPASDLVSLLFSIDEAATLTIEIFDRVGRLAMDLDRNVSTGVHEIAVSVKDLPAGIYLIRVSDGTRIYSSTLAVDNLEW